MTASLLRFAHADAFVGVLGSVPASLTRRVRRALPDGVCAARSPIATIVTSANGPGCHVALSAADRTGCLIEGHLFEARGVESPLALWNIARTAECGSFTAVFWNEETGEVRVRTDALGYRGLYYYRLPAGSGAVVVASSLEVIRALVSDLKPDPRAFIQQLVISSPIGDRTLLSAVKRLRPERELRVRRDSLTVQSAERASLWNHSDGASRRRNWAEEIVRVASEAVVDWAAQRPIRVALSGGYDSRFLLELARRNGLDVRALTLGNRDWVDHRLASKVAHRLDVPHRTVTPPSRITFKAYLQGLVIAEHVSDYMSGFWLVKYARALDRSSRPILNGFLGGPISGAVPGWLRGTIANVDDLIRSWVRHANAANVPFEIVRSVAPSLATRVEGEVSEEHVCELLHPYCPPDLPLFQAATAFECSVRQFGFVSVATYGLYRKFSRPLIPLADPRIFRLFGQMGPRHLGGQRAYRQAVSLVDRSLVPVASTSARRPTTFKSGPRHTVMSGLRVLAPTFDTILRDRSRDLAEIMDSRRVRRLLDRAASAGTDPRLGLQSLMLVNAALLWLVYSGLFDPTELDGASDV